MHYYEVAPTKIVRQTSAVFTYHAEQPLAIGSIVRISVGKTTLSGVVLRAVAKPRYDTKLIDARIEETPLPSALLATAQWMSAYYATHLATVLQAILPRGITTTRRARATSVHESRRDRTQNVLTADQKAAIQTIETMTPGSALLHGITGSGKTRIYIELAEKAIARGESVIVLVPEIALTSQLVDEFSHHFADIILSHSRQTEAERHLAWRDALTSSTPRVIIGPRSALFLPLQKIGLIVIDEAHEPTFKQEQSPRYSALRVASILSARHGGKLVLGSATPSIADYYLAEHSGRPIITLERSARADTVKPTVALVDMTKRTDFTRHRFLSDSLLATLEKTFAEGKQALIFHNRRGTTATTLCKECGWVATCPDTFIPLTLHADQHVLRSHVTGKTWPIPTSCPECGSVDIIHKGIGTKLIETELAKLFPKQTMARFDGDAQSGQSVDERYKELYDGSIDLIIGTQVIAKGLDLPELRTVGVIQADAGLALPDYSSSERTFQLLAQVVGRVGRSHHPTTVIVQSYQPTHLAVVDGLAQNYHHFYDTTLTERRRSNFPPFSYLLQLTCVYKTEAAAIKNAKKLAAELRPKLAPGVQLLGPTPAFYERQHDTYRWQLLLRATKRQHLLDALEFLPTSHWQYELDPVSLI